MTVLIFLLSCISYILITLAFHFLHSVKSSLKGIMCGFVGMAISIFAYSMNATGNIHNAFMAFAIGGAIGVLSVVFIKMTQLPQLMAAFHSLVGAGAVLIGVREFNMLFGPISYYKRFAVIQHIGFLEISAGMAVGAITFTGSIIAFAKLSGWMGNIVTKMHNFITVASLTLLVFMIACFALYPSYEFLDAITALACFIGVFSIIPIGGADMPVVVSILNSYSGIASIAIGVTMGNLLLIIVGAIVASSGAMLSYIMCKGMNRSILNVFSARASVSSASAEASAKSVKSASFEDAAFIMKNASSVVIIPGYGMAAAHAQYALREMADMLKNAGISVRYAVHPVAGRMPGHMNVLLAEADVAYEDVEEHDSINQDMEHTDVVFIIGANDIVNPSAKTDKQSPIYGMPVFDAWKSGTVLFIKRSMGAGYSGIDNPLFYYDKTFMVFGDAKKVCDGIIKALE